MIRRGVIVVFIALLSSYAMGAENDSDSLFLFEDSICAWNLSWKAELTTVHNQELLVLCFDCTANYGEKETFITILKKLKKKGHLYKYHNILFKKHSEMASSYFEHPQFFKSIPAGDSTIQQFFLLREVEFGTGHYNTEHVYHIDSTGEITELEKVKRTTPFEKIMKDVEDVRKNGFSKISGDTLYYVYYIWGRDDSYCCPRSGKVTTTYGVFADSLSDRYYIQAVDRIREGVDY